MSARLGSYTDVPVTAPLRELYIFNPYLYLLMFQDVNVSTCVCIF